MNFIKALIANSRSKFSAWGPCIINLVGPVCMLARVNWKGFGSEVKFPHEHKSNERPGYCILVRRGEKPFFAAINEADGYLSNNRVKSI